MTTITRAVPLQHEVALAKANEIRLARAAIKRRVKAGEVTVAGVLDEECVQSMPVLDLLMAQRRWGLERARRLVRALPAGEALAVGNLTQRQRAMLVSLLGGGAR